MHPIFRNGARNNNASQPKAKYLLLGLLHNVGLATKKSGNWITDCLALFRVGKCNHPLAIEVKINANNPWYAVVENLQQVRMLRGNVKNIQADFASVRDILDFKGAWGMVLTDDPRYFEKNETAAALPLIQRMVETSEARVMLGVAVTTLVPQRMEHIPRR